MLGSAHDRSHDLPHEPLPSIYGATRTTQLLDLALERYDTLALSGGYTIASPLFDRSSLDALESALKELQRFVGKGCAEVVWLNFNVNYLENGSRNPHKFKILDFLNDDEKYLIMSENRPCTMNWLILSPKI